MNSVSQTQRPGLRDQSVSRVSAPADRQVHILMMSAEQVQRLDQVLVPFDRIKIADRHNETVAAFEPQLGTQEFAEMYARRDATRQKLIEIMRQYVADKFRGESK